MDVDKKTRKKSSKIVDDTYKMLKKADDEAMKQIPKDLPDSKGKF